MTKIYKEGDVIQVKVKDKILKMEIKKVDEFKYTKEKIYFLETIVIGEELEELENGN